MVYMCAVVDLCEKRGWAYGISTDMTATLVTDTIRAVNVQSRMSI